VGLVAGRQRFQALQAQLPSGRTTVRVVDADLDGVVVSLAPGVTVDGRFSVEGQTSSVFPNIQQMGLVFMLLKGMGLLPVVTTVAADGTFQIGGLRDGEYRVNLRGVPPQDLYLKTVHYGSETVEPRAFKYSGSGSGIFEVVFRSGAAQLSGIVTDTQSRPVPGIQVILIPAQRTRAELYRTVQTDQNGGFSLTRLTPGEYKIFSWEAIDNGAQYDPEFLKQYEQQGKSLSIAEGSSNNVDVKLIPAR
jgi:hypothetical protein